MTRSSAQRAIILVVATLIVVSCNDGPAGTTTSSSPPTSLGTTGPASTVPTSTAPGSTAPGSTVPDTTTSPDSPEVWEDSACLQRYDPARGVPPDGFVPHFICEDDPTRIAPVARGFQDPMEAIDAVLDGPNEEETAVGFASVGNIAGYDFSEGDDIIEVVLDGRTTPELAAAVKATLERGTDKPVTVR